MKSIFSFRNLFFSCLVGCLAFSACSYRHNGLTFQSVKSQAPKPEGRAIEKASSSSSVGTVNIQKETYSALSEGKLSPAILSDYSVESESAGIIGAVAGMPVTGTSNRLSSMDAREYVREDLEKLPASSSLSAEKKAELQELMVARAEKLSKKSAHSPAQGGHSITFTRTMLIGVILLLAGIVIGSISGGLSWLATVAGLVVIIIELVRQL